MTIASATKTYTSEEYLALEVESDTRSEFRNGEIVETTGGTPEHNEIIRMFVFLLTAALRKQPYSISGSPWEISLDDHPSQME